MENTPRKPYDGFMGTPAAKVVGLVLAFAVCFFMMYMGLYTQYCLFVFIGVLLFVIPKLFGVKDFKVLAVLGVVFLVATTCIGGLCFSAPIMEDNTTEDFSDEKFTNLEIVEKEDGKYQFSVDYAGSEANLHVGNVGTTTFKVIFGLNYKAEEICTLDKDYQFTMVGNEGRYTADVKLDKDVIYSFFITGDEGDETEFVIVSENLSDGVFTSHALKWNLYVAAIVAIMFFLILILTTWMRANLEKTRKKMEAEGRLYPQGYGRCKDCGMLVLPGENVCRKCGAPIDVPEEYRRKPVQQEPAVKETFQCSDCGKEVPSDATVCPHCGAEFDEE